VTIAPGFDSLMECDSLELQVDKGWSPLMREMEAHVLLSRARDVELPVAERQS
jgi:hypothetical protein